MYFSAFPVQSFSRGRHRVGTASVLYISLSPSSISMMPATWKALDRYFFSDRMTDHEEKEIDLMVNHGQS